MDVKAADIVLCEFYFSDAKASKNRPVLVLKDNLPHNDFLGIAISSKINKFFEDEFIINLDDFETGSTPVASKVMLRKTFVISKDVVLKKYGSLKPSAFNNLHKNLCNYLNC